MRKLTGLLVLLIVGAATTAPSISAHRGGRYITESAVERRINAHGIHVGRVVMHRSPVSCLGGVAQRGTRVRPTFNHFACSYSSISPFESTRFNVHVLSSGRLVATNVVTAIE